jgi:hypothetical protein
LVGSWLWADVVERRETAEKTRVGARKRILRIDSFKSLDSEWHLELGLWRFMYRWEIDVGWRCRTARRFVVTGYRCRWSDIDCDRWYLAFIDVAGGNCVSLLYS